MNVPLVFDVTMAHHPILTSLSSIVHATRYASSQDENGRTALDWARLCDARRCILVLEEAMGKEIESKRSEEFGRIKREEVRTT